MIIEERTYSRAITLRLEEMQLGENLAETDEFKDNSTLDADSLKGDPFEGDEDWEEKETMSEPVELKEESWWVRAWRRTQKMYDNFVQRM